MKIINTIRSIYIHSQKKRSIHDTCGMNHESKLMKAEALTPVEKGQIPFPSLAPGCASAELVDWALIAASS
jgi:hypothetical protein